MEVLGLLARSVGAAGVGGVWRSKSLSRPGGFLQSICMFGPTRRRIVALAGGCGVFLVLFFLCLLSLFFLGSFGFAVIRAL